MQIILIDAINIQINFGAKQRGAMRARLLDAYLD